MRNRLLAAALLLAPILLFTESGFTQPSMNKNTFGVQLDLASPGLGVRSWMGPVGFGGIVGTNWGFTDFFGAGRVMLSMSQVGNRPYLVGRVGYRSHDMEDTYFTGTLDLLEVGIGLGYEWWISGSIAVSADAGYNFVGAAEYSYTTYYRVGNQTYSLDGKGEFTMPVFFGGSFSFYF